MKAATLIAVGLATFSSFPGTAQQEPTSQQQQQQQIPPVAPTATPQAPGQPGADAVKSPAADALKPVSAELVDKLDSKSAKQGDSVVVKTDENLQISQGTEIPRGSKLIGRITNVQPRSDGHENAQIAIQFDRAELKGGQTLPIESVIQSVAPAVGAEGMSGTSNPPQTYGDASSSAAVPTGSMGSAPGAASGAVANSSSGTSSTGTMNQNTANAGNGSNATMQPGSAQQSASPAAPGTLVARNGNVAIRTTSVPGVLLANDIHGLPFSNASGLLLGARRDVHLDGGTRMVLGVAMAPQSNGSGMSR
ncbi:hypothetical protein [Occallatibacter savannae]|uniref:hypothetical protein n=1 Tax=Occallatibacter savannae TaxID=1002691 RepID=UPI0013A59B3B|nr:hypothetical protein [Occallatibacter savannae]